MGITEYQNGRHEDADRLLQQALLIEPRSAAACSNHGIVLHELKRYDAALARFDKAPSGNPPFIRARWSRRTG